MWANKTTVLAAWLFAAVLISSRAPDQNARVRVDVSIDWSPFRVEATTEDHSHIRFDPQRIGLRFSDKDGGRDMGSPQIAVMRVQRIGSKATGALVDYAISAPPTGLFRYTLGAESRGSRDATPIDVGEISPGYPSSTYGYMYLPPAPAHRAQLKSGAQFADVYGTYGNPMEVFTVATLRKSGGKIRVTLQSESGRALKLDSLDDSAFGLSNLMPLENDRNVIHLQRGYRGRAWALGKVGMYCGGQADPNDRNRPSLRVIDDRSVGIKRIMRVHGFVAAIAPGSPLLWGAEEGPHFFAVDPIVIVYSRTWPGCTSSFWLLADTWQVERFFSPVSVDKAHPEWSSSIRSALNLERVRPGMTHDMVAWARGYPMQYGTVESLKKESRWDYDIMAKYAQWAVFKGDRLVEYHGTGGWPP